MSRELRAFSAACTFMTRIPAWRVVAHDVTDLPASAAYFPLVGLIVGSAGAAVWWVGSWFWTPWIAVLLSMAATIRLTGAFHEDALADSLDGFGGGWTREQVLHIMKDSRVGSYALVGMCVALVLKAALLVELATVTMLPANGITGRWPAAVLAMLGRPCARSGLERRAHRRVALCAQRRRGRARECRSAVCGGRIANSGDPGCMVRRGAECRVCWAARSGRCSWRRQPRPHWQRVISVLDLVESLVMRWALPIRWWNWWCILRSRPTCRMHRSSRSWQGHEEGTGR
jgi:cobalamin synthase